ncbi:benenodin family lasso peptide [Sphingopyxis sp. R3-92]
MDRHDNELIELGSVSADTAGGIEFGAEPGGRELVTGLRQD